MDAPRMLQRVLASPRFAALALAALAALAAASLDVPQGIPDREVIQSWSRGTGPFVALLGLHHLGRGLLAWALLAALGAHAFAARAARDDARPRPRWTAFAPLALALASFGVLGFLDAPAPEVRDRTRLVVRSAGEGAPQVVEEGSAYRLPGSGGDRTVVFGTLAAGPWAAERRADGSLAVHLPRQAQAGAASFQVDARRPRAVEGLLPPDGVVPVTLSTLASLAAALAAAALLFLAAWRRPSPDPAGRPLVPLVLAASALVLLANPFSGPGTAVVPAGAGVLGTPVLHALAARGAGDVASWVGAVPATVVLTPLQPVLWLAVAGLLAALAARLARPGAAHAGRRVSQGAGLLLLAAGAVAASWTILRLPLPGAGAAAEDRFVHEVLARLPASLEVARWTPTAPGPYTLPLAFGILSLLAFAAPGAALLASEARPSSRRAPLPWAPAALALVVLALLRSLAVLLAPALFHAPAAVVPLSALSAVLAAAALAARGLFPDRESPALALAVVASALQLSLAA